MKKNINPVVLTVLLAILVPLGAGAAAFSWSDNFTTGSTINSATPVSPTANSTSYEMLTSMTGPSWLTPSVSPNDLCFGTTNTAGGNICEIQALFSPNSLALTAPGDYIQITVVFTNTAGIFCSTAGGALTQMGFGLYSSGQVLPIGGGYYNEGASTALTGYAQNWKGYVAMISDTTSSLHYQIQTRPAQTDGTDDNQDLISQGSGSKSFHTPTGTIVKPGNSADITFTTNQVYTEVLTIAYSNATTLLITNALYTNSTASGTPMTQTNGVAGGTTNIVSSFDAFSIGFYKKADTSASNVLDIASITVSGQATPVSGPPIITAQPTNTIVATNGACAFIANASGYSVTYQWHRNGTNLNAGGNISVVNSSDGTSSLLVITNAGPADLANNYYVTVSGTGNFSTNSVTNSLSLIAATNLYWGGGAGAPWDINTSANWNTDDAGEANMPFNFGDPVVFDDGGGGGSVNLTNVFLSAASVTVNEQSVSFPYTFSGSGSFAGPGNLIYIGSTTFTISNANTFSGGTIISNASAYLKLGNLNGLGTGPITLAGGQMEIIPLASSSSGIASPVVVASNFTFIVDATNNAYGVVFNGDFSGTAGQTLTIEHNPNLGNGTNGPWTIPFTRIRASGTNTVYNANLVLGVSGDTNFLWACYQSIGSQTYNGVISGFGAFMQKSGITYLNGANNYSGWTTPAAGAIGLGASTVGSPGAISSGPIGSGPLMLFADSTSASPSATAEVFPSGGDRTIANAIMYYSTTNDLQLNIGGTNSLTFTGPVSLNGNDNYNPPIYTNRTFRTTNTTTFAGAIGDNGAGCGLIKAGPGALYLNGVNTYTGLTSNNSSPTNGLGLLAGIGTIAGPVFNQTNSAIGGGSAAAIGTLTINNNLTNNGNVFIRVNKSLAPQSNDVISVSGMLANSGTGVLYVTNLGPALVVGDKFKLFNKVMTGGSSLTVSNLGSSVIWSNGLAVDGSITVLPSAPPTIITQPAGRAVALGSSVTLSVTASTSTGVTNYAWQMNSNSISAGNVSGITASALTITNFQATNAGYYRAVVSDGNNSTNSINARLTLAVSPTVASSGLSGTTLTLQIPTEIGPTYLVQTNSNLTSANWQTAATISGDGTTKPFTTIVTSSPQLFIRVKMQ